MVAVEIEQGDYSSDEMRISKGMYPYQPNQTVTDKQSKWKLLYLPLDLNLPRHPSENQSPPHPDIDEESLRAISSMPKRSKRRKKLESDLSRFNKIYQWSLSRLLLLQMEKLHR